MFIVSSTAILIHRTINLLFYKCFSQFYFSKIINQGQIASGVAPRIQLVFGVFPLARPVQRQSQALTLSPSEAQFKIISAKYDDRKTFSSLLRILAGLLPGIPLHLFGAQSEAEQSGTSRQGHGGSCLPMNSQGGVGSFDLPGRCPSSPASPRFSQDYHWLE